MLNPTASYQNRNSSGSRKRHRVECRLDKQQYCVLRRLSEIQGCSMSAMLRIAMVQYVLNLNTGKAEECSSIY